MSRPPDAVTRPVAQMVTGARPSSPAASAFPLRTLVPRVAPEFQLLLNRLSVDVTMPAGQILATFTLGTVESLPGNTVTAVIDGIRLSLSFSQGLLVTIDPDRVLSDVLVWILKSVGGLVRATYQLHEITYIFPSGTASCGVSVFQAEDMPAASRLVGSIRDGIEQAVAERISATKLGDSRYSLFLDPDPPATIADVFAQITGDSNRAGSTFVLGQIEEALKEELLTPATHVRLQNMTLLSASAGFVLGAEISRPNKARTRMLRLVASSSLTVTAHVAANLAMLVNQASALAPEVSAGRTSLLNAARSTAPLLNLRRLSLEGTFDVILTKEGHLASFSKVSVTPDGTVDVSQIILTPTMEGIVTKAAGVDVIAADRSLSSLLAVAVTFLQLANVVRDPQALAEVARQQPELVVEPLLSAAVRGHQSQMVEPLLQKRVESQIEAALTDEVRELLTEYVEKPLRITLEQLLQGRQPKVRAVR